MRPPFGELMMKKHALYLLPVLVAGFVSTALATDYYVDAASLTPDSPFTNGWSAAAINIQDAVNVAAEGDTIWIRPGHYVATEEPEFYQGFNNVVYIDKMLSLRAATNEVPGLVLIDGEGVNRGIGVNSPATVTADLLLEGLTISNCVLRAALLENALGAGLHLRPPSTKPSGWKTVVNDCIFTHNNVFGLSPSNNAHGAGIYYNSTTAGVRIIITNCLFSSNSATNNRLGNAHYGGAGGAAYLYSSSSSTYITLTHSTFTNNSSSHTGGALFMNGYAVNDLVENCRFLDNATVNYHNAISGGGAIHGRPTVRNSLFVGNSTFSYGPGSAIYFDRTGPLYLYNCTIVSNRGVYGAVHIRDNSAAHRLIMTNSIVYHNSGYDLRTGSARSNEVSYSCYGTISGSVTGTNNITALPGFVDWAKRDYNLAVDSPCVNAGVLMDWMQGATDLDGKKRVVWGKPDLGCYEREIQGSAFLVR